MSRDLVLAVWAALAAGVLTCLLASLSGHGRVIGFGALVDRASARTGWRVALVVGWMWLGWHFFAR